VYSTEAGETGAFFIRQMAGDFFYYNGDIMVFLSGKNNKKKLNPKHTYTQCPSTVTLKREIMLRLETVNTFTTANEDELLPKRLLSDKKLPPVTTATKVPLGVELTKEQEQEPVAVAWAKKESTSSFFYFDE
jgi:hypothetical protein